VAFVGSSTVDDRGVDSTPLEPIVVSADGNKDRWLPGPICNRPDMESDQAADLQSEFG